MIFGCEIGQITGPMSKQLLLSSTNLQATTLTATSMNVKQNLFVGKLTKWYCLQAVSKF